MDDVWFLKQIDWLQELSDDDWEQLRHRGIRDVFEAGQMVFEPSRDPHSVYLLEDGRVRIYRLSSGGDEATLGYVSAGEVFGELAGFGDFARESFASAGERSTIWKIPVEVFRRLMRTRPGMVIEVTRQIGERMKRVESRVESLVFRSVSARVAVLLLELANDFGERDGEAWRLSLRLSQSEFATLVGTSRQSINLALGRFRERGLVVLDDGILCLLQPEALRRIAEGD